MRNQYKILTEKYEQVQEAREDKLPTVSQDGTKEWWAGDTLHRLDGPAVELADGTKKWLVNGKLHRLDGPAIEWANGTKIWRVDGIRHRLDGPAIEWSDGDKAWFIDGEEMTEKEFNIEIQRRNILKKASDETGIEMDI